MAIDFEKAFDSVSWSFLYKALEFFGFDQNLIRWIKLFNNNIFGYILQCGFLSKPIPIRHGCRQGDHISPYLFLLGNMDWLQETLKGQIKCYSKAGMGCIQFLI